MARRGGRQDLFLTVGGSVDPLKGAMLAGRSVVNEFGLAAINTTLEVENAFKSMGANAPAQARALEQAYARTFAEIRTNAQAALSAPSGNQAVDILNAAGARQAAQAAEAKAAALRIVANAAQSATVATEAETAANRVFAIAAEAAAQGAQDEAVALRQQANVLSGVEAQLESVTVAQRRQTVISGQQRAGMQQLSFQIGDVATQFAAGTPPMIIFAQQSGQVIQAISLMSTKTSGFLGFLGGPWGMAISSAAVVLTPFIGKLFQEGEAAKEAAKQQKKHKEAIDDLIEAQGKAALSTEAKLRKDFTELETERQKELQIRRTTAALLEQTKAKLAEAQSRAQDPTLAGEGGFNPGAAEATRLAGQVADLEAQRKKNDERIAELSKASTQAGGRYVRSIVEANSTPDGRVKRKYELLEAAAEAELERTKDYSKYARTLADLDKARQAELKAVQEATRATTRATNQAASDAQRGVSRISFQRPVDSDHISSGFGPRRRPTAGASTFHPGLDYDVHVGTPVKAPAAGIVIKTGNVRGLGQVVWINHGAGTISELGHLSSSSVAVGDRVSAGQVVAKSGNTGISTGPHLDYRVRIGASATGKGGHFVDPRGRKFAVSAGAAEASAEDASQSAAGQAATAARRAEADRLRELAEDVSFTNEEKQLRHRLLDLRAQTAANEEERNRLIQEDIDAEAAAYVRKVELAKSAGKLDEKEAESLLQLNEKVRLQRRDNLKLEQLGKVYDRQFEQQSRGLEYEIQMLRLQLDLAKTTAERKRIAGELLAAEQKQRRLALERTRDDPRSSPEQIQQAKDDLGHLPDIEAGERKQELERHLSPMEEYRKRLEDSVGDMNEALERVKVHGLEVIEDELTAVLMGTESVGAAFKKMAMSIIADLIRIGIQKAILGAIGGDDTSAGSKGPDILSAAGSFLSGLFGGGRAGGGPIDPSKFYLVGENGPELFAPGLSGAVIPNHVLASASVPRIPQNMSRGNSIAISVPISLHAPGADPAQLARLQHSLAEAKRTFPEVAAKAVADAIERRLIQ